MRSLVKNFDAKARVSLRDFGPLGLALSGFRALGVWGFRGLGVWWFRVAGVLHDMGLRV